MTQLLDPARPRPRVSWVALFFLLATLLVGVVTYDWWKTATVAPAAWFLVFLDLSWEQHRRRSRMG